MPSRKVMGLPRIKKGEKLLVIKEQGRNKFMVIKVPKKVRRSQ